MNGRVPVGLLIRDDTVLVSRHLDVSYYRAQAHGSAFDDSDAVRHFLSEGWRQGLNPSAAFDVRYYLETYPDVAADGVNPLLHYLRDGAWSGRLPRRSPLKRHVVEGAAIPNWALVLPTDAQLSAVRGLADGHFDEADYRAQSPDLEPAGGDALLHYLLWGWRQGLHPRATGGFDDAFYRETYPDVAGTDISPLLHYLRWGAWYGRLPHRRPVGLTLRPATPHTPGWRPVLPANDQMDEARALTAGHFDEAHYLSQAPDLSPARGDALLHFLVWGWREELNPGPGFNVAFYLDQYPEVAATDMNPLLHYLRYGRNRDFLPRKPRILWRTQLDQARSARDRAAGIPPVENSRSVDARDLARTFIGTDGPAGLAIVLSHDDFTVSVGGVKNVVVDELAGFREAGWRHLHVWPLRIVTILAEATAPDEAVMQLCIDGEPVGTARLSDLLQAVAGFRSCGSPARVIVHHLAGHAPEHVVALVAAAGTAPPVVWVHDFFAQCTSYALMRNDLAFCGAPPVDSAACAICCYGEERPDHLRRMRAFFAETLPVVLAPSETALAIWRRQGFDHARSAVIPLAQLCLEPTDRAGEVAAPVPRPIRVAHLGFRAFRKGWATFDALAERFAGDGRYAFFQLGIPHGLTASGSIRTIPVEVGAEDREAMVRAIEEHAIDVAVIWSLFPETFCFTLHEALAGGAYVVTRNDAGNVRPALSMQAPDQGCALADEGELEALFAGDALCERVLRRRAKGRLIPGRGTVDWLAAEGMIGGAIDG